jgi:hypothetical protein
MKLNEVLSQLAPVVGLSSMIGAPGSVRIGQIDPNRLTLGGVHEALANIKNLQDNCGSDAAYWGYEGQRAYWQTAVYLFEAAKITGPENLLDVEIPDLKGHVVMDACYHMEQFGKRVLEAAKASENS